MVAADDVVVGDGGCYIDFCFGNDAVCGFESFVYQLIHLTDRNCDVQGAKHGLSSQPWHSLASHFGRHLNHNCSHHSGLSCLYCHKYFGYCL